ncbi:MAG: DUF1549 domain-containing protein, partial [Planctomycetota bacterium]|nr:DUF1549 domain-containing protein [Planctomycetota bacterium]
MRLVTPIALCLGAGLAAQQRGHWSYAPVERPQLPAATSSSWGSGPIDQLALAGMRARGLEPSAPADPAAWLRRVTLDLTGLPPTTEALDAFLQDSSDAARGRVVDAMMATDAFAERWATWWLDLARYADSQGYEKDALR